MTKVGSKVVSLLYVWDCSDCGDPTTAQINFHTIV